MSTHTLSEVIKQALPSAKASTASHDKFDKRLGPAGSYTRSSTTAKKKNKTSVLPVSLEFVYFHLIKPSMNHSPSTSTTSDCQTSLGRYQETTNHDDRGEQEMQCHDSFIATSPLCNSCTSIQMIHPSKFSLAHVDYSSTPTSDHQKKQPQQLHKPNHLSRLRQAGIFDEESPTSILD